MKRRIIKRIFLFLIAFITPLIGQAVMAVVSKLPPELLPMVDPWAVTTAIMGIVSAGLAWALARWQGIPVMQIQTWLAEEGLYAGRIDGDAGPQTKEALGTAVRDEDIHMPKHLPKPGKPFSIPGGKRP